MREMSVAEQRYKAVLAVIGDGRTVTGVARDWGVSRKTLHGWLAPHEAAGLEGLNNLSHRPTHCPHQMPGHVEAKVLEMWVPKAPALEAFFYASAKQDLNCPQWRRASRIRFLRFPSTSPACV